MGDLFSSVSQRWVPPWVPVSLFASGGDAQNGASFSRCHLGISQSDLAREVASMDIETGAIGIQDKKNLLTDEDRTELEAQFTRAHQEVAQEFKQVYRIFYRAADLLLRLHDGTAEGQWGNVLKRLNICRATAHRYISGARELNQIPPAVRAALESDGLDLTSMPVRAKVLEVQKMTKEPDEIAKLVGDEYLHQRKRRNTKPSTSPKTTVSIDNKVHDSLFLILEKIYRDSNENPDKAVKRFDSIVDKVRGAFLEEHQRVAEPKKAQI
jgi:hypothetical protein